ncbi:MAG: NfeD family protein [Candidatus Cloacimonetes bacterium]|jgi:membrane protein implicated in regulation of membrane protease activity|nr:NfeD family protein [Candidatus Cloacimonadota bacterium]MDY0367039.1 NfeD family protein [Candidatus Syntrophosphaera sp.]HOY83992.1 NfeD family protein [Candidatus Syntrophosphaera sp.]HPH60045.1 NfeD family protein [Candidatus Syntrophosphaera sp.]
MINIQPWHVWTILGIVFVIIEIFDPAFFFIALGIGAIATGLLSLLHLVGGSVPMQIIIFAAISFVAFLFTRRVGKRVLRNAGGETNVYALKGKEGRITKAIPAEGKGYVKIGGEEWGAVSTDAKPIEVDAKVKVIDIDGNKLIVSPSE